MAITCDRLIYQISVECDETPTPAYCDVSISAEHKTREGCLALLRRAGWVFQGDLAYCPACVRRAKSNMKYRTA